MKKTAGILYLHTPVPLDVLLIKNIRHLAIGYENPTPESLINSVLDPESSVIVKTSLIIFFDRMNAGSRLPITLALACPFQSHTERLSLKFGIMSKGGTNSSTLHSYLHT